MSDRQESGTRWRWRLGLWVALASLVLTWCGPADAGVGTIGAARVDWQLDWGLSAAETATAPQFVALRTPYEDLRSMAVGILRAAQAERARQKATPGRAGAGKPGRDHTKGKAASESGLSSDAWRCYALWSLRRLAISHDYGPAIRDMLHFSEDPDLVALTPEEEFYYLTRAMDQGLNVRTLKARYERLRRTLAASLGAELDADARAQELAARAVPRETCPAAPELFQALIRFDRPLR